MKKAVVFYSMDGNTRVFAQEIAKKVAADVFELEEVKKRPEGMKAFMSAGFQAAFGIKTKLKNDFTSEIADYEMIYIGTPIWASKAVPAVNSFLAKLKPEGKSFFVFTVQAGETYGSPNKAAQKITGKLMKKGAVKTSAASFTGATIGKCLSPDEAKKLIDEID